MKKPGKSNAKDSIQYFEYMLRDAKTYQGTVGGWSAHGVLADGTIIKVQVDNLPKKTA